MLIRQNMLILVVLGWGEVSHLCALSLAAYLYKGGEYQAVGLIVVGLFYQMCWDPGCRTLSFLVFGTLI